MQKNVMKRWTSTKKLTSDVRPVWDVGFPISNWINFIVGGAKTAVRLQFRAVPPFDRVNRLLFSVTNTLQAEIMKKN